MPVPLLVTLAVLLVGPVAPTVVPVCLVVVMLTQGRGGVVAIMPVCLIILVISAPLIIFVALVTLVVTAGVTAVVVVVARG